MWAVYSCGCTDCFLTAMFMEKELAEYWAEEHCKNPEGYLIKYWEGTDDIDLSDTGWCQ